MPDAHEGTPVAMPLKNPMEEKCIMSQEKVDRYKQEKAHRKENIAKQKKRKKLIRICAYIVIAVIAAGAAFGIYRHFNPKPAETAETQTAETQTVESQTGETENTAAQTAETQTTETEAVESAAETATKAETQAAETETAAESTETAVAEENTETDATAKNAESTSETDAAE